MKQTIIKILKVVFGIVITIAVFWFLIYLGIKGLLGIIIGMMLMSYLLLSKNTVFLSLIKMTQNEDLMDDIRTGKL